MLTRTRLFKSFLFLFFLTILFFLTFSAPVSALTEIEINPVNTPQGAVILIADGLSAPFIYPEFTPHALDGTALEKVRLENLPNLEIESARILEFRAP